MDNLRETPAMAANVISRIHQLSKEFLKAELDKAGVSGLVASHGHILGCLYMEDHLPMWRIADIIKRRKSTLTVLADKLEQEGYIRRETSPDDSRVRRLSLTPKGLETKDVFMGIGDRLQECFWHGFSEEEQKQAMHFLARMEANFLAGCPPCPTEQETDDACAADAPDVSPIPRP